MTETRSTQGSQSGVFAHALEAIANHIATHQLPAPRDISRPVFGPLGIEVVLDPFEDWRTWIDSVVVDAEHNEDRPADQDVPYDRIRTRWMVRLPDSGVRLSILSSRRPARHLVSDGAQS